MTTLNYPKIIQKLFQGLPQRTKEVIVRRFGLKGGERETLEAIGKDYGITRERVRQLEEDGFSTMKPKLATFPEVENYFENQLKVTGGLSKEENLLQALGGKKYQNHAFLLLTLSGSFIRLGENKDYFSLWANSLDSFQSAQKVINSIKGELIKINQPVQIEKLKSQNASIGDAVLGSYLGVSKTIQRGVDGLFGLKEWPEINPRGVKDKAFIVFKKEKKPLHFTEVAKLIESHFSEGKVFFPTVHNELIKDARFVLVGRGTYALKEWGYEPGMVKDVIVKVLKESTNPLAKEEIVEKVLTQRFVKENTVLLNLKNKKYFSKNQEGKYILREA